MSTNLGWLGSEYLLAILLLILDEWKIVCIIMPVSKWQKQEILKVKKKWAYYLPIQVDIFPFFVCLNQKIDNFSNCHHHQLLFGGYGTWIMIKNSIVNFSESFLTAKGLKDPFIYLALLQIFASYHQHKLCLFTGLIFARQLKQLLATLCFDQNYTSVASQKWALLWRLQAKLLRIGQDI